MGALAIPQPPVYRLYQLAWTGLDWLYPPQCAGCGTAGTRWCPDCQAEVRLLTGTVCERCGNLITNEGICAACRKCPPAFNGMRSWAVFEGPLRHALHRLKYNRDVALGDCLAKPMIALVTRLEWAFDLITPVPVGVARRAQRGYNQSTLLALPLALACGRPCRPKALTKVQDTRSQVGLNYVERRANVAEAFKADPNTVRGKRILVIDDVATSGATMQACAVALLSAGASGVFGLTLARAGTDSA